MLIRRATKNDLPQLAQIYLQVRQQTFTWIKSPQLADFQKETKGEQLLVAENEVIGDYDKRVGDSFNDPKAAKIGPYEMKGKDWYAYDYAIVDQLEMDFIDRISAEIPNFQKKYWA
jgi:hypothetical protein